MRRSSALLLCFLCLACTREDGRSAPPSSGGSGGVKKTAAPASASATTGGADLQTRVPGFPLEEVPPFVREDLVAAAQDEFVYDGSPSTLAGCLKDNLPCKDHAIRGMTLIASELAGGATRAEALAAYNRYFGSFPAEKRAQIDISGAPCKGPANAPITIVEFADFQCAHCAAARPLLDELLKSRSDVRVCFKNFPLPAHPFAFSAAQAGVFANRKGKFWQVHDQLFENQQKLSDDEIKKIVAAAGLDPKELVQAITSDQLAPAVEKDKAEGEKLGVEGTPTLFVNGRSLGFGLTPDLLLFTLADELEWKTSGGKWSSG
jgi:predicted DsbA family dithiol-disulfide isomerase